MNKSKKTLIFTKKKKPTLTFTKKKVAGKKTKGSKYA